MEIDTAEESWFKTTWFKNSTLLEDEENEMNEVYEIHKYLFSEVITVPNDSTYIYKYCSDFCLKRV